MPSVVDLSGQPPSQALPDPQTILDLVDFDTETSKLHPDDPGAYISTVSLAWRDPATNTIYAGAWPFGQGGDDRPKFEDRPVDLGPAEYGFLVDWLRRAGGGLSGHNIVFDLQYLALHRREGYDPIDLSTRMRWDTQIVAQEIWPQLPSHALKSLAVQFFGEDADAEQQALKPYLGPKTDARYDRVPWEVMHPYALKDAIYTNQLRWKQAQELEDGEAKPQTSLYVQLSLTRSILDMQLVGVPYAPDLSLQHREQLEREVARLAATLPFRATGPAAVKWFFEDPNGPQLKPYELTKAGKPSLTSDIVARMVLDEVPHADVWAQIGRYKSAISKWYGPFANLAGPDQRIRSSLRQNFVRSGRLSAGRINLQAVPQDYKIDLPVPTPRQLIGHAVAQRHPGWELWDLDLEQAELRIASMYAGAKLMLEMVSEGRDAHGETATQLFGTKPGDAQYDLHRNVAKRANFGLIFGAGPQTFQETVRKDSGVKLTDRESRRIVYSWRDLYPEFGEAIETQMAWVDVRGYVQLPNGRRRYYAEYEDSHSAFNQLVQSMQAEYTKEWLIYANRLLRPYRRQGGGMLLMVHDSLLMLLPADEAQGQIDQIRDYGLRLWEQFFPHVPGGIDASRWDTRVLPAPAPATPTPADQAA